MTSVDVGFIIQKLYEYRERAKDKIDYEKHIVITEEDSIFYGGYIQAIEDILSEIKVGGEDG